MVDEKFAIFRPLKFLLRMNWPNIELIKDIHRPILFISAAQDEIIPTHHSYDLYAAAIILSTRIWYIYIYLILYSIQ